MATPDLVPLFGHGALRARLADAVQRNTLPGSMLFSGPAGVGKQRLALWMGQILLCRRAGPDSAADSLPCGECQSCRYSAQLAHPDLFWIFPRVKPKNADPSADGVARDYAEAVAQRVADGMLYPPGDGMEGIHIDTVKALVHFATRTPAMGSRKVIVIGDAERMVVQTGMEDAANAFLKLLEEPPDDTTVMLTSSEPGALLPTIRSRVVNVRVARLPDADIATWVQNDRVRAALDAAGMPAADADRIKRAHGSPGMLLGELSRAASGANARTIYEAAQSPNDAPRFRAALQQTATGGRGGFADALDDLTDILHERLKGAVRQGDGQAASTAYRSVLAVADAKTNIAGNANPQLVAAGLLRVLSAHPRVDR